MSTPPRRRRTEPRRPSSDGGWLPTIAMGLGVIVAGLGIGALIAVYLQRTPSRGVAVVTATSAPAAQSAATRGPVAIATLEPPRTPRPRPSPRLTATADASPPDQPTSKPATPPPTAPAAASRSTPVPRSTHVAPSPAVAVAAAPSPDTTTAQPAPSVAADVPAPATVAPTPQPAAMSSTTPIGAPPVTVSAYDEHASTVVRRYIAALVRGDQKAAYGALGPAGGSLSEQSFIDGNARIVSLKVTRIDASNASVGCEIASAKGHFYATYHVTAGGGGPYIAEHDYIKV